MFAPGDMLTWAIYRLEAIRDRRGDVWRPPADGVDMGGSKADRTRASIDSIDRQILNIGAGATVWSDEALRRLCGMLRVHAVAVRNARADSLTIRGPVWRSVEAVSGHLASDVCPVFLDRFERMLPMADRSQALRADGEASVIQYAEAIAMVFSWEATVGKHVLLRASIQKRLAEIAAAWQRRIDEHLRLANEADIPDFRHLGRDILRAEVAEWALSQAGAPEHSAAILQRANRVARDAVKWAARVFERFRVTPDELSHFDAVATLAAVDELLVVILRVHDSDRMERESGSHPFVLTIGEQALQEFVTGLRHMTGRYLQIADQHLLADGAPGSFVSSVLRVLDRILRVEHLLVPVVAALGVEIDHAGTISRMAALQDRLRARIAKGDPSPDHLARFDILDAALGSVRT